MSWPYRPTASLAAERSRALVGVELASPLRSDLTALFLLLRLLPVFGVPRPGGLIQRPPDEGVGAARSIEIQGLHPGGQDSGVHALGGQIGEACFGAGPFRCGRQGCRQVRDEVRQGWVLVYGCGWRLFAGDAVADLLAELVEFGHGAWAVFDPQEVGEACGFADGRADRRGADHRSMPPPAPPLLPARAVATVSPCCGTWGRRPGR